VEEQKKDVENKSKKVRIDILLTDLRLVESRERAKLEIMAGNVYVNGQKVVKPSKVVSIDSKIEIRKRDPYVSRGAHKLKGAIADLGLKVEGKIACDIGASTGGFTQVLLEMGAKRVFAVDVGRGQLHWSLRKDERVVTMEKVNARYLKRSDFPFEIQVITCDVSFISIAKILPVIKDILVAEGEGFILVKPQFEAPKEYVKKGLIKDPETHIMVLEKTKNEILKNELSVVGLTFSKVKGQKGNIEFFYKIKKVLPVNSFVSMQDIKSTVFKAHEFHGRHKEGDEKNE